jgi:hypothetical protein
MSVVTRYKLMRRSIMVMLPCSAETGSPCGFAAWQLQISYKALLYELIQIEVDSAES